MSKEMTLIVLGISVAVLPYVGIPGSWRTALFILAGAVVAGIGFLLRGAALSRGTSRGAHHSFVENTNRAHTRHANSEGTSSHS